MSASVSAPTAHAQAPAAGWLRRLLSPLVDAGVYDFWAGLVNPAWSWERPLARVVERRVEAQDTVTLVLKPNRNVGSYRAGQHVNISAEVNGRRTTRSYSLTSVPGVGKTLSITVKRVEGGHLSSHLCQHTRVGDVLELGPAFGEMTWPAHAEGAWLFLAAGSGITPLMGLTRAWLAQQLPVELTLVYWVKTRAELCFARELRALADREPRFALHVVLTHEAQRLADEHTGLISAEQLHSLVPGLAQQQVYACGPGGFVDAARHLLQGSVRSFLAEGFTPAAPRVPADVSGTVQVTLVRSQRELTVPAGLPLLDALEAQGLNPPSGCRMGICHTCVCTKHSGVTQDVNTQEQDTEPDTTVRLCVSRACSDLSLDL